MSRIALERVHVAGMSVARAGLAQAQASEIILSDAAAEIGRVYVFINAHSAKLRRESLAYACVIADEARTVGLADGASVTLAAKLLGYGDIGRCPGPDFLEVCSAACARDGVPVFFMGGHPGVADRLSGMLRDRHPGLNVVGTASPPFGEWPEEDNRRLVQAVKDSGARLLWLGVSAPKQEIWAYEHGEELGIPIACVGAAFNFNSGLSKRAPQNMQKAGIEWMYRLWHEPARTWRRYLIGNPLFVWGVLRHGRRLARVK